MAVQGSSMKMAVAIVAVVLAGGTLEAEGGGAVESALGSGPITVGMLARDPELMGTFAGYSQAPLYFISGKAYLNFGIGVLALLWFPIAAGCCPRCIARKHRNAWSGEEVQPGDHEALGESLVEGDYQFALQPGHRVFIPDRGQGASQGTVTQSLPILADPLYPPVTIRLDSGEHVFFGECYSAGFENTRDLRQLKQVTYVETGSSFFMAPFRVKPLSVIVQASGILASGFAEFTLWQTLPTGSVEEAEIAAYLLLEHSSAVALLVATVQTCVLAVEAEHKSDRCIAWGLFVAAAIAEAPMVVAYIWLGGKGILIYAVLPVLSGALLLPAVMIMLVVVGVGEVFIGPRSNMPLPDYGGKSKDDIHDEYAHKNIAAKGWFLLTYVLPRNAQACGFKLFLGVAYTIVASLGIPLWWLLLGGAAAMPAAASLTLEVVLPIFFLLLLSALKIGYGIGFNLGRSGFIMILTFGLALLAINFLTLAVQASVLVREADVAIGQAVPLAFASRHGALYAKFTGLAIAETISSQQDFLEQVGANGTAYRAKLAVTHAVSLIT